MIETFRFRSRRPRRPDNATEGSWGNVIYGAAATLAALIVALALGNYFYNLSQNRPLIPLMPLLIAGAIWLIGYFVRYLISDR